MFERLSDKEQSLFMLVPEDVDRIQSECLKNNAEHSELATALYGN